MTDSPPTPAAPEAAPPAAVDVTLTRGEFLAFNWALALERPLLPFLLYTFVLAALAGLLGVWPAGRVFAAAALLPALAYALWVWASARALWTRNPGLAGPRRLVFKERSYLVEEAGTAHRVRYDEVARVLETRAALYLLRAAGGADLVPKRAPADLDAVATFLRPRVAGWKRSSFL